MKKTTLLFTLLIINILAFSQPSINKIKASNYNSNSSRVVEKVDYSIWNSLLSMYVKPSGLVDYRNLKEKEGKLDEFLKILSTTKITNDWTTNEKIAYWINVYNAYTFKLILKHYPVASIKDIDSPWKTEFFKINGETMSLGHVEHKILRKFDEPRIHFAINCASYSCPRVIQIPYKGKNLDRLLKRQTAEYINDDKNNEITGYFYKLSKLFSWFSGDFKGGNQTIVDFVNMYSETKIKNQKNKGFIQYDWRLNALP
ncbi:DUF547 domain-containing protein [Aquimarina agarivorans]|uniref:DUF547 domain-containing protein n=1 Tax=Aquimarina agarivorans TaxID=980584 RepID=UPI000248F59B|nr:DUF547 domain-containing protein [Aquimarina agarivorans]